MSFSELELSESLLRAVEDQGYSIATPIQAASIPVVLEGRDLLGCAQTGTGKTAAFALPTIQRLTQSIVQGQPRRIRGLVLAPTRELATQIGESFKTYGKHSSLRTLVIFGGVGQVPQVKALQRGIDILVATPGRLCDLMQQGHVRLRDVEVLILDEADQMLDLGFIHDLKRIVSQTPADRQTLFFSATMPPEIRRLANEWLSDPVSIEIAPQGTPTERIQQSVYFAPSKQAKPSMVVKYLEQEAGARTIVFTRTKHGADKLVKHLLRAGMRAEAIHGDKSQNARQQALLRFKSERPPVLVATDIAARGLDIDGVSHVINYDLPMTPELYVHRIGRTARAGASGVAIMLCDPQERGMLKQIERLTRIKIDVAKMAIPAGSGNAEAYDEYVDQEPYVPQRPQHSPPQNGRGHQPRGPFAPRAHGGHGPIPATEANRPVRLARRRNRRAESEARGGLPPSGGPSPGYRGPKFKKRPSRG